MPESARNAGRKISVTKIVSESFELIGRNPAVFIPPLLGFIVGIFLLAALKLGNVLVSIGTFVVVFLFQLFVESFNFKIAFWSMKGAKMDLRRATKESFGLMHKVFGSMLVQLAIVFVWFLVFLSFGAISYFSSIVSVALLVASFVALLHVAIRFSMALPGIVLDGRGVVKSYEFSWKITRKNVMRLFLLYLAMGLMSLLVFAPAYLVSAASALRSSSALQLVALLLNLLATILVTPFSTFVIILAYSKLKR